MKSAFTLYVFLFCCTTAVLAKTAPVTSPNGELSFQLAINQHPAYAVSFQGNWLIRNSRLGMEFADGANLNQCRLLNKPIITNEVEQYNLVVGKASSVVHPYRKALYQLQSISSNLIIQLEVRVFNDGLAFRYLIPQQAGRTDYALSQENTAFNLLGNPTLKALLLPNYTTSHEGLYTTGDYQHWKEDTLMDMPTLVQFNDHCFMGITEAALLDYAGMYLIKHEGVLGNRLSPLPGQTNIAVKAQLPHQSPWRVLLISDRLGGLIESNIITSLNKPCAFANTDWIQTGTTTFPWWNGTIVPDTSFTPGNNFETNQYYIDFCAANHVRYHTVVEYGGHAWYQNDGDGYAPGPNTNVMQPVRGLDMKQVCDYAKSKQVGVRVWVHWQALYPKLDSAFALFEQWGLSGMMVDFMDRDDQEMVNIQTEILEKAAKHHLHIQFHGAYKPTGLHRTYPNEFTREGTLNYECDKWNNLVTPDADINIVFTRMLAGSTDYHLGGFRAVNEQQFKVQYTRPLVMGTRCHMLGMYVVLENYQGMMCDYPDAYLGQPGFEVLQHMPTTWDETKVLQAQLDGYVCIARRKGSDWYIAAINNHEARTVQLSMSFLSPGTHQAELFRDADDVEQNANHLNKSNFTVNHTTNHTIHMAPGGGFVMILHQPNH